MHSVIQQMNAQSELIVIDDGSSDDSLKIANELKARHPHLNIKVIWQTNEGVSSARNLGINRANNEFIALLDADDTYDARFFKELIKLREQFPNASVLATNYHFITTGTANIKRRANIHGVNYRLL